MTTEPFLCLGILIESKFPYVVVCSMFGTLYLTTEQLNNER